MVDINECEERDTYKCEGKCKNTLGDYECKCPLGKRGDGKVGCHGFGVATIASCTTNIHIARIICVFWSIYSLSTL